jgi:sirohydrochlorin cobaltochelatase
LSEVIVLFAHGSRDGDWARPFQELARALSAKVEGSVRLAFLELMRPSLDEAIAALVGEGATVIRVVPVFLGQGGHVKEDLPQLLDAARRRHPATQFSLEPPIGEQASVIEAIATAIAARPGT